VQFNDVDIDVIDAPRRYGQSLTFTFRIKRDNVEIAQGTPVTGAMLGDLYNVDVAGVTDNQILSYDAATGNWVPADDAGGLVDSVNGLTGTVILNFDDLNDVDTGTPSDGQLIAYQQGEWVTIDQDEIHIPINSVTGLQTELNTIPTDLNDLSDVSIVGTPTGNQALIYDGTANVFKSLPNFTNRFEDEAEINKQAITPFAERVYTVKADGDGIFIDAESDTPTAGKVIKRKIYQKAGFLESGAVIGDFTLIHTFADDTAYSATESTFEGFRDGDTYGTPPFTLIQTWEEETAAPSFTGLLNESYGSGASAAYGTRRLNGNYSGDCMTIRRASDGTTQSIGFVGEEIDESAITTFCTGTTCTVQVWHDQSQTGGTGSGNDATQTTAANQPTIYTGGQLVKDGGRLALDFDGSNDILSFSNFAITSATNKALFIVGANDETGSIRRRPFSIKSATGTLVGVWQDDNNTSAFSGNGFGNGVTITASNASQYLLTGQDYAGNQSIFLDGTAGATNTSGGTNTGGVAGYIGGYDATLASPANQTYLGRLQEIITYTSDKSTDRTDIEGNISAYYQSAKLLDEQFGEGAEAAYSTRQLRRNQTECMVIRRASDSTTTTIGFDGSGNIDEAAITTFCTGTSCTVQVWRDQSGNGNDLTQSSGGNQPTIYTGGALVKEGGRLTLNFDGINDDFEITNTGLDIGNLSSFMIGKFETTGSQIMLSLSGGSSPSNKRWYMGYVNGGNINFGYASASTAFSTPVNTNQNLFSMIAGSTQGNASAFLNGNTLGTATLTTGLSSDQQAAVGSFNGSFYSDANIQEVIYYSADKSTDRTSIESNVGDYFTQNTPLLDTYTGAAAAYSLRKLSSSYSGSAIRVRRSSDNTEQDIGFNVFGELDTVSLTAFAGAGDAFVKTWYCQSGNSNDATQTTTANQPQIVSSGAVIVENGKPAVQFDGADDNFTFTTTSETNNCFVVQSTSDTSTILFSSTTVNNKWHWIAQDGSTMTQTSQWKTTSGDYGYKNGSLIATEGTTTRDALHSALADGNQNLTSWFDFDNAIASTYYLGQYRSAGFEYDGKLQEVILYNSNQSAYRTNIEDNINTFYSIY
jgi:hypothetical protein